MAIRIKRSMSPDGKIDSVTVELEIDAEVTDTQAVLDAISITDNYAAAVLAKQPARVTSSESGAPGTGLETVSGNVQAVFDGEPSRTTGKMGPGAIIVNGTKVKSFDAALVDRARAAKANGKEVSITYKRNEKWKSNDATALEVLA